MSDIYDGIIAAESARTGIPFALLKGMIDVESKFNTKAFRREVKVDDASRGLMQVLYSTATLIDPTVEEDDLFVPEVGVRIGASYLANQIRRYHNRVWHGVSAYNAGSARIVTEPTRICLARDQKTGDCIQYFNAVPGQFTNQPYVDKVKNAMRKYDFSDVEGGSSTA